MNSTIKVPDDIREIGGKYMYPKYGTDSQYILCMDNSRARTRCSSRQLLQNKINKLVKFLSSQGGTVDIVKEPYHEASMQKAVIRIDADKELIEAIC